MIAIYLFTGLLVSLIALGAWKAGELALAAWEHLARRRFERQRRSLPRMLSLSVDPVVRERQRSRIARWS